MPISKPGLGSTGWKPQVDAAIDRVNALDGIETSIAAKQDADSDLTAIAAIDAAQPGVLASDGSGWLRKSYAALKAALGLVKADVGLANVDNTSDVAKPVSTAGQAALDAKANSAHNHDNTYVDFVNAQSIGGVKTFTTSGSPVIPAPIGVANPVRNDDTRIAAIAGKGPLPEATTTPRTAALGTPSGLLGYTNRYALTGAVTEALPAVTEGAVLAFAVTANSTTSLTLTRNGTDVFGEGTAASLVLAPGDYYFARGQVVGGQGRWRRLSAPLYSEQDAHNAPRFLSALKPEQFGAVGDGATDDTTALSQCITQASSQKRGVVLTGVYLFSSLSFTLDDISIRWERGAKLLCSLNKTDNIIPVRINGSRVRLFEPVLDFTIAVDTDADSPTRPADADGFRLGGNSASQIRDDIQVIGGYIRWTRNTPIRTRFATRVKIDRVVIEETPGNGILFETCADSSITNCEVKRTGDDLIVALAGASDYAAGRSKNITVANNHVSKGYANGVNFTGVDGGVITGNIIEDTWAPGIRVWQDSTFGMGSCRNVQVGHNVIRNPGRYFGAGQFKTTAMAVPVGFYSIGPVERVTLHPQTIVNPQGADISVIGGGVTNTRPGVAPQRSQPGSYIGATGVALSTGVSVLNRCTYHPVVFGANGAGVTININVATATAGALVRAGLHADDGMGLPGPLLAEGATLMDASSTGLKTTTIAAAGLAPGLYWLAAAAQGASATLTVLSGRAVGMPASQNPAVNINGWTLENVTGALPSSPTGLGQGSASIAMTLGI